MENNKKKTLKSGNPLTIISLLIGSFLIMADLVKGVLVILLVFIGLGLVLYLLINNINIPPAGWAPFVDGSRIRIRSLVNDRYLVPAGDTVSMGDPLTFTGNADASSVWQLCQDPAITGAEGIYMFYRFQDVTSNASYIAFGTGLGVDATAPFVFVPPASGPAGVGNVTCPDIKARVKGANIPLFYYGATFQLVEDGSTLFGNVTSNVYNIISARENKYLYYNPIQGNVNAIMAPRPTTPNQEEYSFVIEVVPL